MSEYAMTETRENEITFSRVRKAVSQPEDGYVALAAALWGKSLQPPEWHARAACAQLDPEVFDAHDQTRARWAKTVCAGCPVAAECARDQRQWEHSGHHAGGERGVATVRAGLSARERYVRNTDLPTTDASVSA